MSENYRLLTERHGFPVYQRKGQGFLYVRKFSRKSAPSLDLWVFGSAFDRGFYITLSLPPAPVEFRPPAISPANWTDWTNHGTREKPVLERNELNQCMLTCLGSNDDGILHSTFYIWITV